MIPARHRSLGTGLYVCLIAAGLFFFFLFFRNTPTLVDEWPYQKQITAFLQGNLTHNVGLSMPPSYHWLVALLLKPTGIESLAAMRLVSMLGAATGAIFFFQIVARLYPGQERIRTLQYLTLPVLSPYWFLIYTDLWSLSAILLAISLALQKRYFFSCLAITLASLIRQPAVIWAGLIALLIWDHTRQEAKGKPFIRLLLRRIWVLGLLLAAFLLFMIRNHGVALYDRQAQSATINPTSLWFFLVIFAVLFLPQGVTGLETAWKKYRPWIGRIAIGVLLLLLVFGLTFDRSNPFNAYESLSFYIEGQVRLIPVLHNQLLIQMATSPLIRFLTLLAVPLALAGLCFTPLATIRRGGFLLLAFLSVIVLSCIDPRYDLVPLALFLAFRTPTTPRLERATAFFYFVVSSVLAIGSARLYFFP